MKISGTEIDQLAKQRIIDLRGVSNADKIKMLAIEAVDTSRADGGIPAAHALMALLAIGLMKSGASYAVLFTIIFRLIGEIENASQAH